MEVTLSVLASGDVVASLAHAPSTAQHAGGEMATNQTPAQLGTSSISAAAAHYVPGLDDSVTSRVNPDTVATTASESGYCHGDRAAEPSPAEGGGALSSGGDDGAAQQQKDALEGAHLQGSTSANDSAQEGVAEQADKPVPSPAEGGGALSSGGGDEPSHVVVEHDGFFVSCHVSVPQQHVIDVITQLKLCSCAAVGGTTAAAPLLLLRNEEFASGEHNHSYMLIALQGINTQVGAPDPPHTPHTFILSSVLSDLCVSECVSE